MEEEDGDTVVSLLPTHYDSTPRRPQAHINQQIRLADVWDEREEVFSVGEESDDEAARQLAPAPNKWNADSGDVNHATVRQGSCSKSTYTDFREVTPALCSQIFLPLICDYTLISILLRIIMFLLFDAFAIQLPCKIL